MSLAKALRAFKELAMDPTVDIEDAIETAKETFSAEDADRLHAIRDEELQQLSQILGPNNANVPAKVLQHCLSPRSVLSTASCFAQRLDQLQDFAGEHEKLRVIGQGRFAVVLEIPGTDQAIKKALVPSSGPGDAAQRCEESARHLKREFKFGVAMSRALNFDAIRLVDAHREDHPRSSAFAGTLMPRVPWYGEVYCTDPDAATDEWWADNKDRFPVTNDNDDDVPNVGLRTPLFHFERAPPLHDTVRTALIEHFFQPEHQKAALENEANRDCLIRPYLGARSTDTDLDFDPENGTSQLRDFPLYLDHMLQFDMDPAGLARDMALGLASAHYVASVNMADVEWRIGTRSQLAGEAVQRLAHPGKPTKNKTAHVQQRPSFRNRAIQLWLFDFNGMTTVDVDHLEPDKRFQDIKRLVVDTRAANANYYPHACPSKAADWAVWHAFMQTYIEAGVCFMEAGGQRWKKSFTEDVKKSHANMPLDVMKEWMKQEMKQMEPTEKNRRWAKGWKGGWFKDYNIPEEHTSFMSEEY